MEFLWLCVPTWMIENMLEISKTANYCLLYVWVRIYGSLWTKKQLICIVAALKQLLIYDILFAMASDNNAAIELAHNAKANEATEHFDIFVPWYKGDNLRWQYDLTPCSFSRRLGRHLHKRRARPKTNPLMYLNIWSKVKSFSNHLIARHNLWDQLHIQYLTVNILSAFLWIIPNASLTEYWSAGSPRYFKSKIWILSREPSRLD